MALGNLQTCTEDTHHTDERSHSLYANANANANANMQCRGSDGSRRGVLVPLHFSVDKWIQCNIVTWT